MTIPTLTQCCWRFPLDKGILYFAVVRLALWVVMSAVSLPAADYQQVDNDHTNVTSIEELKGELNRTNLNVLYTFKSRSYDSITNETSLSTWQLGSDPSTFSGALFTCLPVMLAAIPFELLLMVAVTRLKTKHLPLLVWMIAATIAMLAFLVLIPAWLFPFIVCCGLFLAHVYNVWVVFSLYQRVKILGAQRVETVEIPAASATPGAGQHQQFVVSGSQPAAAVPGSYPVQGFAAAAVPPQSQGAAPPGTTYYYPPGTVQDPPPGSAMGPPPQYTEAAGQPPPSYFQSQGADAIKNPTQQSPFNPSYDGK